MYEPGTSRGELSRKNRTANSSLSHQSLGMAQESKRKFQFHFVAVFKEMFNWVID